MECPVPRDSLRFDPSVTEVARNFAEYINRVAFRGERFVLLRGNKPVAELRPVPAGKRLGDLPDPFAGLPRLTPVDRDALSADLWHPHDELSRSLPRDLGVLIDASILIDHAPGRVYLYDTCMCGGRQGFERNCGRSQGTHTARRKEITRCEGGHMSRREAVRGLDAEQRQALLDTLRDRFERNMGRHEGLRWANVQAKLESDPEKLWSLGEMERTGGEPDVIGRDGEANGYLFLDCSKESPGGRRSVCYDRQALEARKKHKPENSAVEMAANMGVELLPEEQYRRLQEVGEFDTKTSSWLRTPREIRELGGAVFGDFRYGTIFVYHNGAESYYAARGFRCSLRV